MVTNLVNGLTALGNWPSLAYLFAGALIGMFLGVVPGLGGAVVLSIILAFIFHLDVTAMLCLFLGTHAASYFSASVSSILLNTPAHPEAFAVTLDGFPMAQRGEAGRALGISAASTCVGGLIGCAILVALIQVSGSLPNLFHPPEYVALIMIALLLVGTLGSESIAKALISVGLGLMIASIGASGINGIYRYTFNAVGLAAGVSLVALALGCFAIPQMVMVFGSGSTIARQDMTGKEIEHTEAVDLAPGFSRQVIGGVQETFRHWALLLQSAIIGTLTGLIPGVGGFAANFLSYGVAQQTSRDRSRFGSGIPQGIIAPEGSSISKEAGGMIPIIALGIPGGVGGALLLAALSIKGVRVGAGFTQQYPTLPYEIAWIIALSGIIGTVAGVLVAPLLAKVTKVPGPILVPFVLSMAVIGTFVTAESFFSIMELVVFGVIGLALRRLRYSLAAFIIGLVLAPTLEENIYLTHVLFPHWTFISRRPLADGLFLLALAILAMKAIQLRRDRLKANADALGAGRVLDPSVADDEDRAQVKVRTSPYPLLSLIVTVLLVAISVAYLYYGMSRYSLVTETMPAIGGFLVAVPALVRLPRDVQSFVRWRASRRASRGEGGAHAHAVDAPAPKPELVSAAAGPGPAETRLVDALPHPPDEEFLSAPIPAARSTEIKPKSWGRHGEYTRELAAFGWLLALVLLTYVFGFVWGIPAFVFSYCIVCTGRFIRRPLQRLVFATISSAVMWVVTYEILNITHLVYHPVITL